MNDKIKVLNNKIDHINRIRTILFVIKLLIILSMTVNVLITNNYIIRVCLFISFVIITSYTIQIDYKYMNLKEIRNAFISIKEH